MVRVGYGGGIKRKKERKIFHTYKIFHTKNDGDRKRMKWWKCTLNKSEKQQRETTAKWEQWETKNVCQGRTTRRELHVGRKEGKKHNYVTVCNSGLEKANCKKKVR